MASDISRALKKHPAIAIGAVLIGAYVFGRKHEQQITGLITPLIPGNPTGSPGSPPPAA